MADFLDRLLGCALGQTTALRRRQPSRFEPTPYGLDREPAVALASPTSATSEPAASDCSPPQVTTPHESARVQGPPPSIEPAAGMPHEQQPRATPIAPIARDPSPEPPPSDVAADKAPVPRRVDRPEPERAPHRPDGKPVALRVTTEAAGRAAEPRAADASAPRPRASAIAPSETISPAGINGAAPSTPGDTGAWNPHPRKRDVTSVLPSFGHTATTASHGTGHAAPATDPLRVETARPAVAGVASPASRQPTLPASRSEHRDVNLSPPAVQITIGRVEIRAASASTGVIPAVKRPAPRMSLEDYLRQRSGGGS